VNGFEVRRLGEIEETLAAERPASESRPYKTGFTSCLRWKRSASESEPYNGAAWHEFGEARAVCRIGERQHAGLKPRRYISKWAMRRRRREVSDSGLIEERRQECLRYGRRLARVDGEERIFILGWR